VDILVKRPPGFTDEPAMFSGAIQSVRRLPRGPAVATSALVALAAACLFGYALLSPPKQPIRLAINAWVGYEFAVLACELGYYEEEGVDVRILELSSLDDVRRTYEHGRTDGMFGTSIEVVQSRESGRDAVPVLIADFSNGADTLIVNRAVASIAGLRGMRVGCEVGTLGSYVLMRALESGGLGWDDVEIVHTPYSSQHTWMELGLIDAVVTFPPVSTDLLATGRYRIVFSSADIPGEVVDLLAIDPGLIESRPHDIDAIRRAYFRAVRFAEANPAHAHAIMAERLGISAEEVGRLLDEEIRLVSEREQPAYLGDEGTISEVIERTRAILNAYGSLADTVVSAPAGEGG